MINYGKVAFGVSGKTQSYLVVGGSEDSDDMLFCFRAPQHDFKNHLSV